MDIVISLHMIFPQDQFPVQYVGIPQQFPCQQFPARIFPQLNISRNNFKSGQELVPVTQIFPQ